MYFICYYNFFFKLKFLLFSFIIILFLLHLYFFQRKVFNDIENFYILCNNSDSLNTIKYFNKTETPKISIIAAIYNKEKYLLRFIRSIQSQNFENIEIILIDDCSTDNSIKIIEDMQTMDKRIILIKHSEKKGTLISRNDGIIKAKGEYLIIPDPDDIFLNDILNRTYKKGKEHNYDIIRFDAYIGENKLFLNNIIKDIKNKPIYQPELSYLIFYGKYKLKQIDYVLWNKLIKREAYINALNAINNNYLRYNMIFYEDGLINFMLFKKARSFYYMNTVGYYYILNENSIMKNFHKIYEKIINDEFIYLKFLFQYTHNFIYDKKIASFVFLNMPELSKIELYNYFNKNYEFYYKIINLYLNNKYISLSAKNKLKTIKNFIECNKNIYN